MKPIINEGFEKSQWQVVYRLPACTSYLVYGGHLEKIAFSNEILKKYLNLKLSSVTELNIPRT